MQDTKWYVLRNYDQERKIQHYITREISELVTKTRCDKS